MSISILRMFLICRSTSLSSCLWIDGHWWMGSPIWKINGPWMMDLWCGMELLPLEMVFVMFEVRLMCFKKRNRSWKRETILELPLERASGRSRGKSTENPGLAVRLSELQFARVNRLSGTIGGFQRVRSLERGGSPRYSLKQAHPLYICLMFHPPLFFVSRVFQNCFLFVLSYS